MAWSNVFDHQYAESRTSATNLCPRGDLNPHVVHTCTVQVSIVLILCGVGDRRRCPKAKSATRGARTRTPDEPRRARSVREVFTPAVDHLLRVSGDLGVESGSDPVFRVETPDRGQRVAERRNREARVLLRRQLE